MWKIIQFVVVLAIIWVGYNYFFGDDVQKQQAELVTTEAAQSISALKNFVIANKDQLKLDNLREGTEKVGAALKDLGAKAQQMDEKYRTQYQEMQTRKQQLDDLLKKIDDRSRDAKAKKQQISDEIERLAGDMDKLSNDLKEKQ